MKNAILLILLFVTEISLAQKNITIEDLWTKGTFREQRVAHVNWMSDGRYYSALENNKIVRHDIIKQNPDVVLFDGEQHNIVIDDYQFNDDEQKLLLLVDRQGIYRRSFTADYHVYDFSTKELSRLSDNGSQSYATFSPDSGKIAFVRDNNLYYKKLNSGEEVAVTTDGKFGSIINGSTDWVYEEEFGFVKAFFWSPDSKKIAFYRFDESEVRSYNMQLWMSSGGNYPMDYEFKYPKAGEKNAKVDIVVHDLKSASSDLIDLGDDEDIYYVLKLQWTKSKDMLSVVKLNRLQNELQIIHANVATKSQTVVLKESSETYLDVNFAYELVYLDNGNQFLFSSERSGYKHYYLYSNNGKLINQVTMGSWDAIELVGLDQNAKKPALYYSSNEGSSLEKQFYKISLRGRGKQKLSRLLGHHEIEMSPDSKYYMDYYSDYDTPTVVTLVETQNNTTLEILEDNKSLNETLNEYNIQPKRFVDVKNEQGDNLNAYMIVPQDMDSTKQYPLLVFQYSGPGSQMVHNNWSGGGNFFWHQMLVQQGYIVAVVDPRGTGGKGTAFRTSTYKKLGIQESDDIIYSAQYFASLDFVDADRIGVWGWSYGGFMTALCMTRGDGVFKAGISVAPVTDWRFYDTIYTERYMDTPQNNPEGYKIGSPVNYADALKGNYLLIHGTGDDNVHFQNAIMMQNALINANKQFDSFYYPDRTHGLGGLKIREHLFEMMTNYILNKL